MNEDDYDERKKLIQTLQSSPTMSELFEHNVRAAQDESASYIRQLLVLGFGGITAYVQVQDGRAFKVRVEEVEPDDFQEQFDRKNEDE
jgi:hypothetical protein